MAGLGPRSGLGWSRRMSYLVREVAAGLCWSALRAPHVWTHMGLRDVKNRYRGTVVGIGWLFLSLVALSGSVALVYGRCSA